MLIALALAAADAAATPDQDAAAIPAPIRAMVDAALESGNDGEIATIAKYARAADPNSGDAVLKLVEQWRHERDSRRREVLAQASIFSLWTGKVELGGYLTTGNIDTGGVSGVVDLNREGLDWRQKFHAVAEYQESAGIPVREHYLASWEPNYKVDDRAYIYGQAQYESDRYLGYSDRGSASIGAGYNVIRRPGATLDVELGPAYRLTRYTDDRTENSIAARYSATLGWRMTQRLSLKQTASAYLQTSNSTASSMTSLEARLFGPAALNVSYAVQYESDPPAGTVTTGTTTRVGLSYRFGPWR